MAIMQLYPDSLPDYPAVCQNVSDLGFILMPHLPKGYAHVADIWVLVTIGVFVLVLVPFVLQFPQLVIRRWMFLLGILYLLRGLTVIDTRYVRLPFFADKYQPSNPIQGAFMIMIGAHSTATDMVFSGHTVNFILIGSFVSRYTNYGMLSYFVWIANILGIFALISIHEHYLTDIVVAIIITKLSFWVYHLFFDSLYKRGWVSGLTIEDIGDFKMILPARIIDSEQQTLVIDESVVSNITVQRGILQRNGRNVSYIHFDPFKSYRYQLWKFLTGLDSEQIKTKL